MKFLVAHLRMVFTLVYTVADKCLYGFKGARKNALGKNAPGKMPLGNVPLGNKPPRKIPRGNFAGAIFRGGFFLGGIFPDTVSKNLCDM